MITLTHGSFDNWFCLTDERMQRINGADIEGDRYEWERIADAIEHRESISFKRCAATKQPDGTWHLMLTPDNGATWGVVHNMEPASALRQWRVSIFHREASRGGA